MFMGRKKKSREWEEEEEELGYCCPIPIEKVNIFNLLRNTKGFFKKSTKTNSDRINVDGEEKEEKDEFCSCINVHGEEEEELRMGGGRRRTWKLLSRTL